MLKVLKIIFLAQVSIEIYKEYGERVRNWVVDVLNFLRVRRAYMGKPMSRYLESPNTKRDWERLGKIMESIREDKDEDGDDKDDENNEDEGEDDKEDDDDTEDDPNNDTGDAEDDLMINTEEAKKQLKNTTDKANKTKKDTENHQEDKTGVEDKPRGKPEEREEHVKVVYL